MTIVTSKVAGVGVESDEVTSVGYAGRTGRTRGVSTFSKKEVDRVCAHKPSPRPRYTCALLRDP